MCHPGRPSPKTEGHFGSPGFAAFHSTKSSGSRFAASTATRSPARSSSRLRRESLPYSGKLRTAKKTSPLAPRYARPFVSSISIISSIGPT